MSSNLLLSQDKIIDSLKLALTKAKHDTTKCNILSQLSEIAPEGEWEKYNDSLIELLARITKQEKIKESPDYKIYQRYLGISNNNKGFSYVSNGQYEEAIKWFKKSLNNYIVINDAKFIIGTNANIGHAYLSLGQHPIALIYFIEALKVAESAKIPDQIAKAQNDLGGLYYEQGDITTAKNYFEKNLKILEKIGDKNGLSTAYNNVGMMYKELNEDSLALFYINKSLELNKELNRIRGILNCYNNIGTIYSKQKRHKEALLCYNKVLELLELTPDKASKISIYDNIARLYYDIGNYKLSLNYALKSMSLAKESESPVKIRNTALTLKNNYERLNNYKLALENYELYIKMRDSLNNIETQKATIKQQTQYEYEKKKALTDKEHELQLKQQEEQAAVGKQKQNIIIASVSIVLVIVALFSVFLYNRFKVTQKQKAIIELKEKETHAQKEIITEKHKEITDSINYAERIQRSFLATKELLDENLTEYFILFKPKDVVSGDFYWAFILNNGNFAFVTADSTGHGVPGAIMSLLNITSLEKAIETETSPDKILNSTRKTIIERLKKDGSVDGGKDGMDCSLISLNKNKTKLEIASAHNPVWIMRGEEVIEIKADKMPVGKHDRQNESFTLHEIELQKGDVIYTLTDGFPDQFGGEKGKKFMSKNLRELLAKNSQLPMLEQKSILEKTFADWVGNLEQVDDVTLVGIRV